jgi:hypothetical protein
MASLGGAGRAMSWGAQLSPPSSEADSLAVTSPPALGPVAIE